MFILFLRNAYFLYIDIPFFCYYDEKRAKTEEFTMPVIDDIRNETNKMKDKTLKEKLAYFWGYYKFHTLAVIALLILVIWFIYDMVNQQENIFYALLVNAGGYEMAEDAGDEFAEYADINLNQYDIKIDTSVIYDPTSFSQDSYYGAMKISAVLAAGEVDTFISPEDVFYTYALSESFFRLDEVLSKEQIAAYEGDIYYVDQADIDARDAEELTLSETTAEAFQGNGGTTAEAPVNPRDPSQMENPLAVGIYLNVEDIPFFMENNCYLNGEVVYGFMCNSSHSDNGIKFLSYLTGK